MQRPKRPGRYHPGFTFIGDDASRPGTPTPEIRSRTRYNEHCRRVIRRVMRPDFRDYNTWNHMQSVNINSLGSSINFNPDQVVIPPPRPVPPPPATIEPLPGPSSNGDNNGNNISSSSSDNLMSRLLSVLECPVCFEYVSPPILQCREGHLVCSGCRARLDLCPKCRQPFADIRARALEQVAEVMPYPCNNVGCGALLTLSERQTHESICPFRQYPCTIDTCAWLGKRSSLPIHMAQYHPNRLIKATEHVVTLNLTQHSSEEKVFLMQCHDEIFHCVTGSDGQQDIFVGFVMYLGPREKAADFEFVLSFGRETPPYTSITIKRATLEESPVGTHVSPGLSAVVISFSTLREVIQDSVNRNPILNVHISVNKRSPSQPALTAPTPSEGMSSRELEDENIFHRSSSPEGNSQGEGFVSPS